MRISVVTVCFNSAGTIGDCVRSVLGQRDVDLEYIVIDGASTDGTLAQLAPYKSGISKFVSEPDRGIYDAMNKGLALATGDYVGFLNSDDYFPNATVLSALAKRLQATGADATLADVLQVNGDGRPVRLISGAHFNPKLLRRGVCPPHPTFYARTEVLRRIGGFRIDYRIAGDFDLMVRFFSNPDIRFVYVPECVATMRMGGISTRGWDSYMTISREMVRACRMAGLSPSYAAIYGRFARKFPEFVAGLLSERQRAA